MKEKNLPTDSDHICVMCSVVLTDDNVARHDATDIYAGGIRKDAFGKLWCQTCTDKHDSIDFSE